MQPDFKTYYNGARLLSRNAMFNFVTGQRGNGKTFYFLHKCIKDFIDKGDQFIYMRRFKSEFKTKGHIFDNHIPFFPGYEFRVAGNEVLLRPDIEGQGKKDGWQVAGFLVTLANAQTFKSTPFPHVRNILFDEFILDKGALHYLPDEVRLFEEFYQTVDRWRDVVRCYFCANALSIANPYFTYYGIIMQKSEFARYGGGYICVEISRTPAVEAKAKATRFGQFKEGTAYFDYAIEGAFKDDSDFLIEKKTPKAKHKYNIVFADDKFSIWVDYAVRKFYVSRKIPKTPVETYSVGAATLQEFYMLDPGSDILKDLVRFYKNRCLYFDTPFCREKFNLLLKWCYVR
jgi:hypothetical protein